MKAYEVTEYPKSRLATFDIGIIANKKHFITGLLEVDVTDARSKIKEGIKSGRDISFISWFLKVLGDTIAENKNAHALNWKRRKQIIFNDADISIIFERRVNGAKVPLVSLIRRTNVKSLEEIYREMRGASGKQIKNEGDYMLSENNTGKEASIFYSLPQKIRLLIWKRLLRNPFVIKRNMGTAIVTNVAGAGKFPGWLIPKSVHNLCVGLGPAVRKPWVIKNDIVIRDILHLTLMFNHDAIDGSPAARFAAKLIKNLEDARGL